MLDEPQPGALRWEWTSFVFAGADREDRRKRLDAVPEEMREYVKDRIVYLFSLNGNRRK